MLPKKLLHPWVLDQFLETQLWRLWDSYSLSPGVYSHLPSQDHLWAFSEEEYQGMLPVSVC